MDIIELSPNRTCLDCKWLLFAKRMARLDRSRLTSVVASLWFAWVFFTAGDWLTIGYAGYSDHPNWILNAVFNLFTPILFANWGPITVPILFLGLWQGDRFGKRIKVKTVRIVFNMATLFVLTMATDMITWGRPLSLVRILDVYECATVKPRPQWCPVMRESSPTP